MSSRAGTTNSRVFNVLSYGAVGDNNTDNTEAFSACLKAVVEAGGDEEGEDGGGSAALENDEEAGGPEDQEAEEVVAEADDNSGLTKTRQKEDNAYQYRMKCGRGKSPEQRN